MTLTPEQLANHERARQRQLKANATKRLPRVNRSAGVGARFSAILKKLGYRDACAGCARLAKQMDAWGPDGCAEREVEILDELEKRAKEYRLFFWRPGARAALWFAIKSTPIAEVEIEGELKTWQEGEPPA